MGTNHLALLLILCAPRVLASGTCIESDGLHACAAGGTIAFGSGQRTIITSAALVAAGRRLALGTATASVVDKTLLLQLNDTGAIQTSDHSLNASYAVRVTVNDGRFQVGVDAEVIGSAAPTPAPLPPATCNSTPIIKGTNPPGGDLRHARQLNDSTDPALCRAACCKSSDCVVWALMNTGKPGLGTPCVAGRPCCYLKSASAGRAVSDPDAIASGGKRAAKEDAAVSSLHNLELEFTFAPPHASGEDGVFKWLPNLHRGLCLDKSQQGTSCWVGNDTRTLTSEHFFRSPAVIGAHSGDGFAIIPDLLLLRAQQRAQPPCSVSATTGSEKCADFDPDGSLIPQALDLHAGVLQRGGHAPPLGSLPMTASYGLSSSHRAHHEYSMRDNASGIDIQAKRSGPLFRASLMIWAGSATPLAVVRNVTSFLWQSYGRGYLHGDIRPQIM